MTKQLVRIRTKAGKIAYVNSWITFDWALAMYVAGYAGHAYRCEDIDGIYN